MDQTINKKSFTQLIKSASFKELFNELGWENLLLSVPISIEDEKFNLNAVAEKRGFVIFVCSHDANGKIPLSSMRKKIDQRITKLYYEHLIIYTDKEKIQQIWQLVLRESDKPIVVRETPYFQSQHPELLFQKLSGLLFNLNDEDKITIADVRSNVREQFNTNAEKVTKKFYVEFKAQHTAFLIFIKGIEDKVNQEWYASLMLNRLMFIYFIQKKGFLDSNPNYLRDKLKDVQQRKGKDKFFSFYRNFLLVLFHEGLGSPERSEKLLKEIGKVPYLNGGLFDVHQIEKDYKKIEIEDKAFDKIFKFFDEYNWHLDTKITASGKDINPDVIGYIFEKYINDRAAMGAYYTKEDITEYIAKNTVIPYLFDQVKKDCANAFKDESSLWKMLRDNPDRYIYDSVKHGIYKVSPFTKGGETEGVQELRALPNEIQIGLDTNKPNLLERRKEWNKAAPPEFALPTEIWREVVERRNRYFDVKSKIENGEVKEINDFITYNLNIRQFVQDATHQYEGSDFINSFYKAITKITVLDPTCGSGAFLFAALNILEPLYFECIERMKGFIEEDDRQNGKEFPQFRKVLEEITKHPNQQYYIYKSIILNNLYGVDIMNEAVEIAKLRLFLKLVAEVEVDYKKQNMGLEPLPDIDFNVRCGNTLIGFATKEELDKGLTWSLNVGADTKKVYDELDIVAKAFKRYKEIQLEDGTEHNEFKRAKDGLNERLKNLNNTLNDYLGNEYGKSRKKKKEFDDWLKSHQPFHWFAEFYEIIESGGFNVIIGNPPYLSLNKIEYALENEILKIGDLYGFVAIRCLTILEKVGNFGFIVMHNIAFSRNFSDLRKALLNENGNLWFSFYARIPAGLFSGDVRVRNCIFLLNRVSKFKARYTTRVHRWFSDIRDRLFQSLNYTEFNYVSQISMYDNDIERDLFSNLSNEFIVSRMLKNSRNVLYYKKTAYNWLAISPEPAPSFNEKGKAISQTQVGSMCFLNSDFENIFLLLFNGKLFYSYWLIYGDEFHVTQDLFESFRFPLSKLTRADFNYLNILSEDLRNSLPDTIQYKMNAGKKVGSFNTSKLWSITDISDVYFLKFLVPNPEEVFEKIQDHVLKTIMTDVEEDIDI